MGVIYGNIVKFIFTGILLIDNPVRGICLAILNGTFKGKKDFETKFDKEIISETFKELHFRHINTVQRLSGTAEIELK